MPKNGKNLPGQMPRTTVSSVKSAVDQLGEDLAKLSADIDQMRRTARGIPRANAEAARANRGVAELGKRTDELEDGQRKLVDSNKTLMGIVRLQSEDSADHEERISGLEVETKKLARSESVATAWLASVAAIEVFILIAWVAMKNFTGSSGKLGDSPSYDGLFAWVAVGSFVVISIVAIIISASRSAGNAKAVSTEPSAKQTVLATSTDKLKPQAGQNDKEQGITTFAQLYAQNGKTQELPVVQNSNS